MNDYTYTPGSYTMVEIFSVMLFFYKDIHNIAYFCMNSQHVISTVTILCNTIIKRLLTITVHNSAAVDGVTVKGSCSLRPIKSKLNSRRDSQSKLTIITCHG